MVVVVGVEDVKKVVGKSDSLPLLFVVVVVVVVTVVGVMVLVTDSFPSPPVYAEVAAGDGGAVNSGCWKDGQPGHPQTATVATVFPFKLV